MLLDHMINIPTVFILISILSLTLGVAIRISQTTELKWGLREFSYALIAHGVAYGLFTLAPMLGLWTIWFAEIAIALFFSFVVQAIEVFLAKEKRWGLHWLLVGSIVLISFVLLDQRTLRIICNSLILMATEALIFHLLWQRRSTTPGRGQYLILAAIVLNMATLLYRELTAIFSFEASGEMAPSELSQALLYMATLVGLTLFTVGFLLMAKERTEHLNQQMILSDKLTGVWNRRKLEEVGQGEIQRLVRHGTLASLLILDLDDFKAINDTMGHATGDAVLQAVTKSWRGTLRETDVLGRWGGEEFVVILPGTGVNDAILIAESLLEATRKANRGTPRQITVSIGISLCVSRDSWKSWLDRADTALYRAKAAGKNMACHDIPIQWEDGVSLVHWSPLFETGIAELDADHHRLLEKANQLLANARKSGEKATITLDLNEIALDMRHHFSREEVVISDMYPHELNKHRSEHTALLARLHFLTERFQRNSLPLEAIAQFLAFEMCAHHTAGSDNILFSQDAHSRTPDQTEASALDICKSAV